LILKFLFYFLGYPNLWIFNSKKDKNNSIMMKNSDKLLSFEILKFLINPIFSNQVLEDNRIDNFLSLKDFALGKKIKDKRSLAYIRYRDGTYESL
jgi:hypothetical protein